jgi:ketopantoate reductase
MWIAVMGTGGTGGQFDGLLAGSDADVILIARRALSRALLRDGLPVKSMRGVSHAQATDGRSSYDPVDVVLARHLPYELGASGFKV